MLIENRKIRKNRRGKRGLGEIRQEKTKILLKFPNYLVLSKLITTRLEKG